MDGIQKLSDWLTPVQEIILRHGYRLSRIGGSSAREILDHVLFGVPLALRDLDLYLVRRDTVRLRDLGALCDDIRERDLARIGPLRLKRRANPVLPGDACYQYVAGYGVHLFAPEQPILSLGVLHHESDLALNGLFDIDAVFLAVDNDQPLSAYADRLARHGLSADLVIDPYDGYGAWRRRSPAIVHWAEVERCFVRSAYRIVRSLAKVPTLRLPDELRGEYRSRRPASVAVDDVAELHRDFLKVLGDAHWAEELGMLAQLEALKPLWPPLQAEMEQSTPDGLRRAIPSRPGANSSELSCLRARALCKDPAFLEAVLSVAPLVFGAE
ncbi:hypothetical protein ACFV1F_06800 [Streptomyces sp. NPDC059590]|uniref:hypothetical protein n=1 Tax=Streptomyces sp. NPDC059590 TaxID=3346877 RepID=UPI0036A63469